MPEDTTPRVGEFVRFLSADKLPDQWQEWADREVRVDAVSGKTLTLRPHRVFPVMPDAEPTEEGEATGPTFTDDRPETIDAPLDLVRVEDWQLRAREASA